jgi:signal transduction histidine kinase/ligand-binding sensor domain-containing protein
MPGVVPQMAQRESKAHIECGAVRKFAGRTAFFASLFLFLVRASAAPPQPPYRFSSWTTENGLPQNSIQALLQTRDGYLWISTLDGLVRFDGLRFRVFNRQNTPALTTDGFSFFALLEDRQGCLWAGTLTGGAVRYCNGTFTSLTVKDGLPNNTVVRIDEDEEGTVWIFTNPGLAKWQNGRLIRVAPEPGSPFNPYLTTSNYNVGADGYLFGLWRMEAHGWQRFAYGHWSHFPLPFPLKDPSKLHILSSIEDSQHRFWYRLPDTPDVYYCVEGGVLTQYAGIPPEYFVTYKDRRGYLWAYTGAGQCIVWKNGRSIALPGFSTPFVYRVLEDREGTVWIGTAKEGLYRADPQAITSYQHPNGSQWNIVEPVLQDRTGAIWFGSRLGLFRFDNGKYQNFYHAGEANARMAWRNIVSAIYEDQDGTIWTGTWSGLAKLKGAHLISDSASAEIQGRVNAVLRDRAGDLWVGGENGLYRIRGGHCTQLRRADGLASDSPYVQTIFEDHRGTLWIGTASGLARSDQGRFSMLPAAAGASITALHEDAVGVLWIGTYDTGLARLDGETFTRYTEKDGLFNNGVFQILEDEKGFLWLSCHLGIYRLWKQDLNDFAAGRISLITSSHFGKADGLLSVECSSQGQPTGFKASDGKLWFPTAQGLAVVDPKAVTFNRQPPPVAIEDLSVDGHATDFHAGVKIKPGQENLEMQYTALSLVRSQQIRFRYRLEGLDTSWINAGARRTAYYSRIPPGTYTFRVIAANSDGIWNMQGAHLTVQVLPPFYSTWWFRLLSALTIAGLVYLTWRRRTAQWEQRQATQRAFSRELLASQERERKRIAAELHDSIGQRLVVIKNLALLRLQDQNGSPAAREQVEEICTEASSGIAEVREISHDLRPYQLDRLGLTKALESMVESVGKASTTTFSASIDDIDDLFTPEFQIGFYRITQECLSNILKHAEATEAKVVVRRSGTRLQLTVSDNGKGFTTSGAYTEARKGGFGLINISERVELFAGKLEIQSAPTKGATINIDIDTDGLRYVQ